MEHIEKRFRTLHIAGWSLFLLFTSWVFWSEGHHDWPYKSLFVTAGSVLVFYSHFFILRRYLGRKKFFKYLLGLVFILIAGPLPFLFSQGRSVINDWPTFIDQYFTTLFSIVVFLTFLSWLARAAERWIINTMNSEKLEKQSIQDELNYLKSQINPHFLFNTLNNIHALAYKQSPSTPDAIMRLSSLMRYMLYESEAKTVSLDREVDYLKDYISLQQLRYTCNPIVNLEISGNTAACNISPLLFIHFLENAYKHSPPQLNAGEIKIMISVERNSLTFNIQNPVGQLKASHEVNVNGGIGLANIKKRLELLYSDQHDLKIGDDGKFFKVILVIDNLQMQNEE